MSCFNFVFPIPSWEVEVASWTWRRIFCWLFSCCASILKRTLFLKENSRILCQSNILECWYDDRYRVFAPTKYILAQTISQSVWSSDDTCSLISVFCIAIRTTSIYISVPLINVTIEKKYLVIGTMGSIKVSLTIMMSALMLSMRFLIVPCFDLIDWEFMTDVWIVPVVACVVWVLSGVTSWAGQTFYVDNGLSIDVQRKS